VKIVTMKGVDTSYIGQDIGSWHWCLKAAPHGDDALADTQISEHRMRLRL
jgi:hypothetical protein